MSRISKPGIPLAAYEDKDACKLYFLDVGLLGAATRLDASMLIDGNELFVEFKGALTENHVCQELVAGGKVDFPLVSLVGGNELASGWLANVSSNSQGFMWSGQSGSQPIRLDSFGSPYFHHAYDLETH